MKSITIDIQDKNYQKVLTILEALQPELIDTIHTTSMKKNIKSTPVSSKPINNNNRYLSKEAYKQKLQNPTAKKDEFLSTSPSSSKYLSPSEFKKRLQK